MTTVAEFFKDQMAESDFPLLFQEVIGENAISDKIRAAIVWAAVNKFLDDKEILEYLDAAEFTPEDIQFAKGIMFRGPFEDMDEAIEESKKIVGVLVAPTNLWEDSSFVYIANLSN